MIHSTETYGNTFCSVDVMAVHIREGKVPNDWNTTNSNKLSTSWEAKSR